jgi:hypothetical protein
LEEGGGERGRERPNGEENAMRKKKCNGKENLFPLFLHYVS